MSEAEIADLKDRMAAGSRWLKAEIKGREKAEADARAANAVVVSLEADLAEAEGIIKDRGTAAKPAARDPDDERECAG